MLAVLHLLTGDGELPAGTSWAIVIGGGYGFLRLVWDLLRLIAWVGRKDPKPGDSGDHSPES